MFRAPRYFVGFVAIVLLGLVLVEPRVASAQGLFDFLFKPPAANNRSSAPNPFFGLGAPSESPAASAPRLSGTGRYASYCVRLCDGRYFPIQRTAAASSGELCNSLCPASKTKIFSGSDISYATAGDGTRYSSLENAFVYREKVVDGCTCNGKDAFGLAKIEIADDPTLRKGDMIATEDGLEKFNGSSRATARANSGAISDVDPAMSSRGPTEGERSRERHRASRPTFSFFGIRF
jgi:hypothetical protein